MLGFNKLATGMGSSVWLLLQSRNDSESSGVHSCFVLQFAINPSAVIAGDIVHDDKFTPKKPGCENDWLKFKVQTWVDGIEGVEFVDVGARFGTTIVSKEKNANQTHLTQSNPRDCCSPPKKKVVFLKPSSSSF